MVTGSWKNWTHSFKNDILRSSKWKNGIKRLDQHERKETRIKNSNRNHQIDTNKQTKLWATFIKYATTLYNEVPKLIQKAEKYCAVPPKMKKYWFDKTLARSLSNWKKKKRKGSPKGGVWKRKAYSYSHVQPTITHKMSKTNSSFRVK